MSRVSCWSSLFSFVQYGLICKQCLESRENVMNWSYKVLLNVLVLLCICVLFYLLQNESIFQGKPRNYDLAAAVTDDYCLWVIFTKANASYKLRQNLKRFTETLVNNASVPLSLHIIADNSSREYADNIFKTSLPLAKTKFSWEYHDVDEMTRFLRDLTQLMQGHFSSQPGAYYGDALFFLSIGLHKWTQQNRAIMMDIDLMLRHDIGELFKEFDRMPNAALIAAAPEQTPVYRHVLHMYRAQNRQTKFGEPLSAGGNPGVNSGVLLMNLAGQRASSLYQNLLKKENVKALCERYQFRGHLGDQDWYTLISQEYPGLVYLLDCTWNRQLCLWWRHHGYHDIFDLFHYCEGDVKIYHGNCNTNIPK